MPKLTRTDETVYQEIDTNTGEVIRQAREIKNSSIFRGVQEEDFIKIYYDTYIASLGENHSALSPFLIEVAKRMNYSEYGQIVCLVKPIKQEIANSIGVSLKRVNNMITKCIDLGLLIREQRAVYRVSPFVMAKGEWKNIRALQITYDTELKKMQIDAPRPNYLQIEGEWVDEQNS